MHTILSYRGNRPTNKQTNKQANTATDSVINWCWWKHYLLGGGNNLTMSGQLTRPRLVPVSHDFRWPVTWWPGSVWPLTWLAGSSSWRFTGLEVAVGLGLWRRSSSAAEANEDDDDDDGTRRRGISMVCMSLEKHTRFRYQSDIGQSHNFNL